MSMKSLFCACLLLLAGTGLTAGDQSRIAVPETALRGFGKVSMSGSSDGSAALSVFQCESPRKAEITGSKYQADLQNFGAVEKNADGTFSVRHGGVWKLGLDGDRVMVLSAPDKAELGKAEKKYGAARWKPVPEHAYPRYLDNFDNAGLAFWWIGTTKSPEEMKCFESLPVAAALHGNSLGTEFAPGVWDNASVRNGIAQLKKTGRPYRTYMWENNGSRWANYQENLPEEYDRFVPGYNGESFFLAGGYYSNQSAGDIVDDGLLVTLKKMMDYSGNDKDLLGWMEPHGEFQVFPFRQPAHWRTRFPDYLKNVKKYTLAGLSEAWGENFKSFADATLPTPAYFAGRRGGFIDLDDAVWKWTAGSLKAGEEAGFPSPAFNDQDWFSAKRTDKRLLGYREAYSHIPGEKAPKCTSLWARFQHEIPENFLDAHKKIYFHIMPQTERQSKTIALWINGKPVTRSLVDPDCWFSNRHSCIEVSEFLKPGKNDFVIFNEGGRIAYRVFLSQYPKENMPFADRGLNQRYYDWIDFLCHEKFLKMEKFLIAMRSLDPDRPIKVMTPDNLGWTKTMELFNRLGAYAQLTGEANWYRPMHYKGYTFLYNRSASSEPGGPVNDAYNAQRMFANVFWESQDCHDYGFDFSRDFFCHKSVVEWWEANKALLKTVGKTDFVRRDIGELRDIDNDLRYQNSLIWNYDLSRGTLPGLGFNPVLVNGDDLREHLADKDVKILLDCATVVADQTMVEAIKHYVGQGGVFVTQPITGKDTPYAKNRWPLAAAFGLNVVNDRMTGTVSFPAHSDFLPSMSGKTLPDANGLSITAPGGNAKILARWSDGTGAVVEVSYGKGRFLMLGVPLFTNMKDTSAVYVSSVNCSRLLGEMLDRMGFRAEAVSSDPRIWFQKRISKNGLYDVYIAGAFGCGEQTLKPCVKSNLRIRESVGPVIEAGAGNVPDVGTAKNSDGSTTIGGVPFSPFQIRMYAAVRKNAGLTGPATWLEMQERSWYAIPKQTFDFSKAEDAVRDLAKKLGEDGLDLSRDWSVEVDSWKPGWLTGPTTGWKTADFGAWQEQGFPADATQVRYRKTVELPQGWDSAKSRIFLCFNGPEGYFGGGLQGNCRLFLDGKNVLFQPRGAFRLELAPEQCKTGKLELAFEMTAPASQVFKGPVGAIYLHKYPKPVETVSLDGEWTEIENLLKNGKTVQVPFKGPVFGLSKSIRIPERWKGKVIRLVIDEPTQLGGGSKVSRVIINHEGFLCGDFGVPGIRIDSFLKPGGENLIELFSSSLDSRQNKFQADIRNIRLEIY